MRYFVDTEFLEDGRTIELISIGIVAEDGREGYLEARLSPAVRRRIEQHDWLMANVVPHLKTWDGDGDGVVASTKQEIAEEVQRFVTGNSPEFWAYCGAYDWVVLNQLFGPMVNHPTKWPFYCNDIAQFAHHLGFNRRNLPKQENSAHNALADARWNRDVFAFLGTL